MSAACYDYFEAPFGPLLMVGGSRGLRGIRFPGPDGAASAEPDWERSRGALAEARRELEDYFAGRRRAFELVLDLRGTPFQLLVWEALRRIPYGSTIGYGALARSLGRPGAARAVGLANGANPVPIVVPCHRVVGARGELTGFGGGIAVKRFLLELEGALPPRLGCLIGDDGV